MNIKPNIVFLLTDDQGYGDLGCHGNPWIKTPNIDEYHKEAVRLVNFHVGPTCAPTRAGLLTGHYANSTGVWHTVGGRSLLRKDEWTLANALSENGYNTGIFGKWHLGDCSPYRPQDRGFNQVVIHGGGGISQTPDYWGNDYFDDTYYANGKIQKFKGYCTDVFFEESLKFIEENKDNPFFCYISVNAPHAPYNVENKYADMYRGTVPEDRARFYGMITNIDENFKKLRNKLEDLGIEDNTILIFMTDNGSSCGAKLDKEGNLLEGYNAGLRGLKGSEYDGGHRTPFFIKWANGNIFGGRDIEEITANVDFMPTLLDLCGIEVPENRSFHGMSLKPLLTSGFANWEDRIIVTDSQRVIDPIKWKQSASMTKKWRLINGIELYDIENDLAQKHNIADKHPEIVEMLRNGYDKWWEVVSEKFDEEIPIEINEENYLTTHDWRGNEFNCLYSQKLIRKGQKTTGYWEVYIKNHGKYIVNLYRWPIETGYAINQGIIGDDCGFKKEYINEKDWEYYMNGEKLNINKAELIFNNNIIEYSKVYEDTISAEFIVELPMGNAHLEGRFITDENEYVGAYYTKLKRI